MKILVTGGAGFIGSHTVRALVQHHCHVTVVDDLSHGRAEKLLTGIDFHKIDVLSSEFQVFMKNHSFDAVVHLAAQVRVDCSESDPVEDARQNICGTIAVLKGAAASGVKRIVFSSSAAVYGDPRQSDLPIKESQPLSPLSPYGLSKAAAESYISRLAPAYGMAYVILRFANVYGERPEMDNPGGVIQIFANRMAAHKKLTLYGRENRTRDWIYVGDIAEAVFCSLTTSETNHIFNISTGKEVSLQEVIRQMEQVAGYKAVCHVLPSRTGDIVRSVLDNQKAEEMLHWQPRVSLKDGLQRTYAYAKAQHRSFQGGGEQ
jgi:UDP-glucose 4-epimerase